jgi:hypothetical protein
LVNDDVTRPFDCPQLAGVVESETVIADDTPTFVLAETLHPFASDTVTPYVPAERFTSDCVVAPLLQIKLYGNAPPSGVTVAVPFVAPHVVAVEAAVAVGPGVSIMIDEPDAVHPVASVTVTMYVPATKPLMDDVVAPLFQL